MYFLPMTFDLVMVLIVSLFSHVGILEYQIRP